MDESNAAQPVTVVSVDISAFVNTLKEALDGGGEVRAALWEQISETVNQFGGLVHSRSRRQMLALWGKDAPQADDLERAVRAALTMREVMRGMSKGIVTDDSIQMTIGIAAGTVVLTPNDEEEAGFTVEGAPASDAQHLSAQVERTGDILMTQDAFLAIQGCFDAETNLPVMPPDRDAPIIACRVLGAKPQPPVTDSLQRI